MKTISPKQLHQSRSDTSIVIDVRSPGEFAGLHAEGAHNLPLDQCSPERLSELAADKETVYLICQSGQRAQMAFNKLVDSELGDKLYLVEGGTTAWAEADLPVVKGKGVISIERQVRIGAGFLVLVGVALGFWVHPGFLGISAFVGAGLMFAGITDFCGMGLVLAKMPWNKRGGCATGCQVN